MKKLLAALSLVAMMSQAFSQDIHTQIDQKAKALLPKVIEWRRYIHQHPELSNREYNTSKYIADYLNSLGLEVQTGIAKTGVVAILHGGKPGPCVALRADMDALPIKEITGLPYASSARSVLVGDSVSVMHACGHDAHTAMLLGAATVLSSMKKDISGTIKFIFQPAEEGPPTGEEGGASVMVKEGVMDNPKVDAIFGMHMNPKMEIGNFGYKSGPFHASSDWFTITVTGQGSHGAVPWNGVDPIVTAAQIIMGIQTVVSRQAELTKAPLVATVGKINGGTRNNIIPDNVVMQGTLRALDENMRREAQKRITKMCADMAAASGATATVTWREMAPVQVNNPALVLQMLPSLEAAAGTDHVHTIAWTTTAEDFSYYESRAPAFYFFFGGLPKGKDPNTVSSWHTADFYIDDSMLDIGVKGYCYLAVDYAQKKK
jgi:amidohydrolase